MPKIFEAECWVTQYFGFTDYAKTAYSSGYHNGLDLVPVDRQDWTLYAPCGGEVMETGTHKHYGKYIILYNIRTGARFRFAHLDAISARRKTMVTPGAILGKCGSTGNSTAKHLHLDLVYMGHYSQPDFPGQPTGEYSDPLPALRHMGVNI